MHEKNWVIPYKITYIYKLNYLHCENSNNLSPKGEKWCYDIRLMRPKNKLKNGELRVVFV